MLLLLAVAVEGCCGRVHRGDKGRERRNRRSLSAGYLKFS
jgi:hypothetical protein